MKTVEIVGVVGAGTMGMGIAEVAASHGQKVLVFDVDEAFAHKAHEAMQARLKKRRIRGKITQEIADKICKSIKVVKSTSDFLVCDLVVEAIVEVNQFRVDLQITVVWFSLSWSVQTASDKETTHTHTRTHGLPFDVSSCRARAAPAGAAHSHNNT